MPNAPLPPNPTTTIQQCLLEAARWAPSADNTQPWQLLPSMQQIDIYYDQQRAAGKTFAADSEAVTLSIGAMAENVIRVATAGNIATGAQFRPDATNAALLCRIHLSPGTWDAEKAQQELNAVKQRHTNRHPFSKIAIEQPRNWLTMEVGSGVSAQWLGNAEQKHNVAEMVKQASAIRFQTKEVHEWLAASLRFQAHEVENGDGLDVATFHLPPGGKGLLKLISSWQRMQQLNRIGMYRLLANMEAQPIKDAPAIVAIVRDQTAESGFNAGRLMQRIWLELNQTGLAVQPYYVVSDQLQRLRQGQQHSEHIRQAQKLENRVKQSLGLTNEQSLAMLLRVGNPKVDPVRSRRLPLDQITRN